jgi:hypothetical protein
MPSWLAQHNDLWDGPRSSACPRRGAVHTDVSVAEQRRGLQLGHPLGSLYKRQHEELREGGQNGVLTDEAVGVAAADGVEGGKGAPSSVLELQRSGANIRPCLIGSEKRENGGSPGAVNVICGICSGDRSSCLMMMNPRAKGAHKSEESLLKRNRQRAEPIIS